MYKIEISKKVKKFLEKRDIKFLEKFEEQLIIISQNPYNNQCDIKTLSGKNDRYRLRIGKYRILYEVKKEHILLYFYDANSRGDIY